MWQVIYDTTDPKQVLNQESSKENWDFRFTDQAQEAVNKVKEQLVPYGNITMLLLYAT